jgi:hypothetical protein
MGSQSTFTARCRQDDPPPWPVRQERSLAARWEAKRRKQLHQGLAEPRPPRVARAAARPRFGAAPPALALNESREGGSSEDHRFAVLAGAPGRHRQSTRCRIGSGLRLGFALTADGANPKAERTRPPIAVSRADGTAPRRALARLSACSAPARASGSARSDSHPPETSLDPSELLGCPFEQHGAHPASPLQGAGVTLLSTWGHHQTRVGYRSVDHAGRSGAFRRRQPL